MDLTFPITDWQAPDSEMIIREKMAVSLRASAQATWGPIPSAPEWDVEANAPSFDVEGGQISNTR